MNKKEYVKKLSKTKQVLTKELKEPQSKVERIPIELLHEFIRIGNGNWKQGMTIALISHNTHDPKELLMKDCDGLMHHLELFYNNNHNEHFRNFPAFFHEFLKTGKPDMRFFERGKQ